jgi:HEAT repeat protein
LFQRPAGARLRVCAVAAEAIVSAGSPEAVEKLLRLPENSATAVRQAVVKALASRAGLVDDEMVSSWAHDSAGQIRQAAAELLGIRHDPRYLDDLLVLGDDPSITVRAAALAALGNAGGSRVLDRLISGLEDSAWQVQLGAATGLEAMAREAVDLLIQRIGQTAGTGQTARARWLLDKLGDPADVRLVILARGTGEPASWQRVAAAAVDADDRTVAGSLVTALSNDNPRVRESVAQALAVFGDRNAVIPLAGLLGDPDWEVRLAARAALGQIGSSAVDLLATVLREGNRNVRAGVANMLGKLQAREAVDPLLQALDDSGRLVRANAAEALGRIGDPRAVDSLIRAVRDSDGGVRNNAAAALRRIGTPEALATVREWTLARRRGATSRSG